MKHPSEYTTTPLGGLHVMQVDDGATIKDERSGEEITVTDDVCAMKGNILYCTKNTFQAIQRKVPERKQ